MKRHDRLRYEEEQRKMKLYLNSRQNVTGINSQRSQVPDGSPYGERGNFRFRLPAVDSWG